MQRGSSVNFQPVQSAMHAVSHADRTVPPTYLLPPDRSLGTIVVLDDNGAVAKTLEEKMAIASRQAKAVKGYSPLWEGVLNLRRPEPDEDETRYKSECAQVVHDWCKSYESMTGHKVLRADVHLDEGHIVEGVTMLNAHAHVIADKTNAQGRVIKMTPQKLRELQTVTAEITNLERGVNSRVSGKKHITAHQYKYLAERNQLENQKAVEALKTKHKVQLDREIQLTTHNIKEARTAKAQVLDLKTQIAQLKAQYDQDRATLKASGEATQRSYQALKAAHEGALAELKTVTKKVEKMDAYTKKLEADLAEKDAQIASELVAKAEVIEALVKSGEKSNALLKTAVGHRDAAAKLTGELAEVKAKFAAMANNYQAEKAAGVPAHLIVPSHAPVAPKATKTPAEPSKSETLPIPSPTTQKPVKQALNVVLTMVTNTAAFEDLGRNQEAANVVREAADFIERGWDGRPFDLKDTNGNKVGKAESVAQGGNFTTPQEGGILLVLKANKDLAEALRTVANKLENMVLNGVQSVKDAVGNVIAKVFYNHNPTKAEVGVKQADKGNDLEL
jgi:hypothetical protein